MPLYAGQYKSVESEAPTKNENDFKPAKEGGKAKSKNASKNATSSINKAAEKSAKKREKKLLWKRKQALQKGERLKKRKGGTDTTPKNKEE